MVNSPRVTMAQLTLPLILILGVVFGQTLADIPSRIVGGTNASPGQYPYQVSLRNGGSHFCGGTLVSRRHVVTAAHCIQGVVSPPYNGFTVVTGTVSLRNGGQSHRVASVVVHPNYSADNAKAYPNDIAIVTLADSVAENSNQKIIPVATSDPPVGATLRLTGWGRTTSSGTGPLPDILQTTTVSLLSNQQCQKEVGRYPIGKGHMCTFRQKGIGACFGDSGGPLVYNGKLVGVVSWVFPCAQGLPDAFTRVSQYTSFINQHVKQ